MFPCAAESNAVDHDTRRSRGEATGTPNACQIGTVSSIILIDGESSIVIALTSAGCVDKRLGAVRSEQKVIREQVKEIQKLADTLDPEQGKHAKRQADFQQLIDCFVSDGDPMLC